MMESVRRTVGIDVLDGGIYVVDGADRQHRRRYSSRQSSSVALTGPEKPAASSVARVSAHTRSSTPCLIDAAQRRQHGGGDIARHQQRFHRVARRIALRLGVVADAHRLVDIGIDVDEDVADAVRCLIIGTRASCIRRAIRLLPPRTITSTYSVMVIIRPTAARSVVSITCTASAGRPAAASPLPPAGPARYWIRSPPNRRAGWWHCRISGTAPPHRW